jgi:integrase
MSRSISSISLSPGNAMFSNTNPVTDTPRPEKRARNAQGASHSKTDLKYWQGRIFKPVYNRPDGSRVHAANFAVEICFRGRRIKWSLETPNKEAAAARAKELYLYIQANGWEAAMTRYRPQATPQVKNDLTVGEFLDAVQATGRLERATFVDYQEAFRRMVSEIAGIPGSNKRRFGSGHTSWLEAIHAVKLARITPEKIERWKTAFLTRAKSDPVSQRSARVSANSYLHRAKCLFSPAIVKHLPMALPEPLPFAGVQFEKRPSLKYQSNFDVRLLVRQAREELASEKPELFKIFVLAAMCGLRRREIDLLPWSAFRWEEGILRIEATEFFHPKSEESIANIPLEPELLALFRGYHARAKSPFVIESERDPKPGAAYLHYRGAALLSELCSWLRAHGVKTIRPLHTLRKEFGSVINRSHGIHAASRALRHASIGITAEIYVDSRVRVTSGLGSLLDPSASSNALPICPEVPGAASSHATA